MGLGLGVMGLVPGSYTFQVELEGADWMALEKSRLTLEVSAGAVREVTLRAYSGGRADFSVSPAVVLPRDGQSPVARIELRRTGETEWEPAELSSSRLDSRLNGAKVWLDGTWALSGVLAPGGLRGPRDGRRIPTR